MARMRDSDDGKSQVGEDEGGRTTLAWGGAYMDEAPAQSPDATRLSDSRAARRQRNRSSRRRGESRVKLLTSKLVMAAATLGILLSSLVAVRFIACFESVSLHRLTRRTSPGGTSRRLAGGYELVDLIHVDHGGPQSPAGSLQSALASCPDGTDELLMVLLPPTETEGSHHSSEDLQRPHRQPPRWWTSNALPMSRYVIPLLFLVVAVACRLLRPMIQSINSTGAALDYATYGFLGLAVAAAVAVLSIEILRLPLQGTARKRALLVVPSLLSAVAVASVLTMRLRFDESTGSPLLSLVYGFLGLAGMANAVLLGLLIWNVVVSRRSRSKRAATPIASEDEWSSGDETQLPPDHLHTELKVGAGEKALLVLLSLFFLVTVACSLAAIIKTLTGQSTGIPLSYATYGSTGLFGVMVVVVIGFQIWKVVSSRPQSRSGDFVPLTRLVNGRARQGFRRPHQQAPEFRFSSGEKALLVLPFVLFGVAAACDLTTSILLQSGAQDAVSYASYGVAGLAVVVVAVVLGILTSRPRDRRQRKRARPAWV
ncbi:hypothetical protein CSUI_010581 [Cystoisospora suis]|uniref:Transmembrane protein n=1 Tax=Cystoisospora suis TaxID=483139 RepID=A0A2C6KD98_9APIC|nr:hypothetical protein CSUI_010581 [Cystoisospora suis]